MIVESLIVCWLFCLFLVNFKFVNTQYMAAAETCSRRSSKSDCKLARRAAEPRTARGVIVLCVRALFVLKQGEAL